MTHSLLDAMAKAPARPRFIRHRSAESLIRAFTKTDEDPGGWEAKMSDGSSVNLVESITALGFWGYAEGKTNTIRFWVGKVSREQLLFFFAHELGHLADDHSKQFRRNSGPNDELRADLYGWVSSEADRITRRVLDEKR